MSATPPALTPAVSPNPRGSPREESDERHPSGPNPR
jgi:hypothetical protein